MDRRRLAALVTAAALTGLLVIALSLPPPSGFGSQILLAFGEEHGVHLVDLPAAACWLVGMAACWTHWRN